MVDKIGYADVQLGSVNYGISVGGPELQITEGKGSINSIGVKDHRYQDCTRQLHISHVFAIVRTYSERTIAPIRDGKVSGLL